MRSDSDFASFSTVRKLEAHEYSQADGPDGKTVVVYENDGSLYTP